MTTIAYRDGLIATDGRTSMGPFISNDDRVKRHEHDGVVFFLCGSSGELDAFIDGWPHEGRDCDSDASGFAVKDGEMWETGCHDKRVWRMKVDLSSDYHMAYGSGMYHAVTAMDMGCSAAEAVQMAAQRDSGTGGTIRVYCAKTGDLVQSEGPDD